MTDLINRVDEWIKTDVNAVQEIVNRYAQVLQGTKPEKEIPYLAVIIDACVNHINTKHKDLSADRKAWAVVVVRNQYVKGKIKNDADIVKRIDDFLTFWESNHKKYCEDMVSATEYDRDSGFVFRYEKKIGSR